VRRLDVDRLEPGTRLKNPLAHVSGEIIIGATVTLSRRICEALRASGVNELYEIESLEDVKVLRQRSKLKPIDVDSLIPGTILPSDLYDDRMRLILAAGLPVTPTFVQTLRRSKQKQLFTMPPSPSRELKRLMTEIEEAVVDDITGARSSGDLSLRVKSTGVSTQRYRRIWRPGTRTSRKRDETNEAFQDFADKIGDLIECFQTGNLFKVNEFFRLTEGLIELVLGDYDLAVALALAQNRYGYLQQHTLSTSLLCSAVGISFHLGHTQLRELVAAGLLHDLGMLKIPATIIGKKDPLSEHELKVIHRHLHHSVGYALRAPTREPAIFAAIYEHHERGTGHGYPEGKKEEEIHDYAKLLAVVDAFAAFIRNRPHRPAVAPHKAITIINKLGAINLLNPTVVSKLVSAVGNPPLGSFVEFADGKLGRVVSISADNPTRPKIAIVADENGRRLPSPIYVDSAEQPVNFKPCPPPDDTMPKDVGF